MFILSPVERMLWLEEQVDVIYRTLCPSWVSTHFKQLSDSISTLETNEQLIKQSKKNSVYCCLEPTCSVQFLTKGRLLNHLNSTSHGTAKLATVVASKKHQCKKSESLVYMLLLLRDLWNAYKMCDGDRIFRDLKLALLYFYPTGHSKYRLWVWRMLAYNTSVLSARKAFEYRWNMCANTSGGISSNIPDDNLVELHVKKLKDLLRQQGSNVTFQSASTAASTMQFLDKVKENLNQQCKVVNSVCHPYQKPVDKEVDVVKLACEINRGRVSEQNNLYRSYKTC
jgi:hypothetical protein